MRKLKLKLLELKKDIELIPDSLEKLNAKITLDECLKELEKLNKKWN